MVRSEDLEELAQILEWGEAADSYVLALDEAMAGRLLASDPVLQRTTQGARDLLAELLDAAMRASSPSFDRLSVYSSAATALIEPRNTGAIDLRRVSQDLEGLNYAEKDALVFLQTAFDAIAEAMHRAARELSGRRPSWQY